MTKVAVVGLDKAELERELTRRGFVLEKLNPDIVVSIGGDGCALIAEHIYPGVPRLTIKNSEHCKKCEVGDGHDMEEVLDKLERKQYKIIEEMKVEGSVESVGSNDRSERLVGLNEINVSHSLPIYAIRFDVSIDGKPVETGVIGDGVVVATPYGSTGYFRIITGRKFSKGIGIALNNSNKEVKYRFAEEGSEVRVVLRRGPALMCADNNTTMVQLAEGDTVVVRRAKGTAKLIVLEGEESKIVL